MKVVRQQYGQSARAEALTDLVRETWPQALSQTGIAAHLKRDPAARVVIDWLRGCFAAFARP